jgi:hypothetical protein
VNRLYRALSYHPVVWKRFLPIMPMPLPPLPPTNKHDMTHLTGLDAEAVISRAISLEDNWRCDDPTPYRIDAFTSLHHVQNITIVPGGHYLVASERAGDQHSIVLYSTEHPRYAAVPLARLATMLPAEEIRVRYEHHRGHPGIMISFIQRW